jgi:hypothetical protein
MLHRTKILANSLMTALVAACASQPATITTSAEHEVVVAETDYAHAHSGAELALFVRSDLTEHRPRHAYEELDDLVAWSLTTKRAARTSAIFHDAGLTPLFMHYGGGEYLSAVETLEGLLAQAAEGELSAVYGSLFQEDLASVRAALEGDNLFAETTLAAFPEHRSHALFFEGALAYYALEPGNSAAADARSVAATMDRAGESFLRAGLEQEYFLTRTFAAKALEQADLAEPAVEYWLQAAEASYWDRARDDVRSMIAGRIQTYRDRLETEIRQEVEADWEAKLAQAQADARLEVEEVWKQKLAEAESEYRQQHAVAAARIEELRGFVGSELAPGAEAPPAGFSPAEFLDQATQVVTIADFVMRMCGPSGRTN